MAGELDSLVIRLAAETADARRELNKMERKVGGFARTTNKQLEVVDRSFDRMGATVKRIGASIVAAFAVTSIANFVDQVARATNSMADLADTTGFTYKEFQELRTLMLDQGMGLEKLEPMARSFAIRMGELKGQAGGFYEFLSRHLPTLRDQLLATKSQSEALAVLETAFERLRDPAQRSALANQAFGESGLQFAAILAQQGSQMERATEVAREYGTVIEDSAIEKTRALQREIDLLNSRMTALTVNVGTTVFGTIAKYFNDLTDVMKDANKALEEAFPGSLSRISPTGQNAVANDSVAWLKKHATAQITKAEKEMPPLEFKPVVKIAPWQTMVEKGDPLGDLYADAIAAQEAYEREVKESFAGIARTIETALSQPLADAFAGNIRSAKEYFQQLSSGLAQAIYQATILKPLMEGLTNAMSGGGTTSLGSLFGGLFGGFKASGGPVKAGVPYIVGERGPELMVPRHAGTIVPNHALGGGGSQVVYNIDARGAAPGVEQRIMAALAQAEKQRPPAPQQMAAYGNRFPLRAAA